MAGGISVMAALRSCASLARPMECSWRPAALTENCSRSWSEPLLCGEWHTLRQFRPVHQFHQNPKRRLGRCRLSQGITLAETAVLDGNSSSVAGPEEKVKQELFACPICFEPLIRKGVAGNKQAAVARSGFQCRRCKKTFSTRDVFLDLTILSGAKDYEEPVWLNTQLFRSPIVSFVYERGWRQGFARADFPGPDEEFRMAQEYLKPTFGGLIVDVSCGSGVFTRRFAKSGLYKSVVGLDFSENMLRQTSEFIKNDTSLDNSDILLIRADVGRLPFATGSVDAIHAGAAIHCWPSPATALAEISRVLRPGGVFVATTFLAPQAFLLKPISKVARRAILSSVSLRAWEESELDELCSLAGFVGYSRTIKGMFLMFSTQKPE
eukprot:TRINITY_DN550_c0_g1_i3.p1 TRINITY_DN550_c0_g1~~TRINITY_DN550_c0_g1_i3.p1  ORF type:complete len:380 (-),score=33.52 TRINITY_DN550_c0_g1_i3:13-1152(-)